MRDVGRRLLPPFCPVVLNWEESRVRWVRGAGVPGWGVAVPVVPTAAGCALVGTLVASGCGML
jgi:hypothetical protein